MMRRRRLAAAAVAAACLFAAAATARLAEAFVASPGLRTSPSRSSTATGGQHPAASPERDARTASIALGAAAIAGAACALAGSAQRRGLAERRRTLACKASVGDAVGTFSFCDENGSTVTSDTFAGKQMMIWWYPKADTGGWTKEGLGFMALNDEFLAKNTQVIGASTDKTADNKAWSEKLGFPFPLLSDGDKKLPAMFGATTNRWAVLVDEDRKVKAFWPEVKDKPGFAAEALAEV